MSGLGNKEIMSKNLRYYIEKSGKDRRELADAWGFPYSTVSEWINGKKYPRIDRIEIMADYFGILKSDLIEEKTPEREEVQKKAGTIADTALRMKTDPDFLSIIKMLLVLDKEKLKDVLNLLTAFLK